MPSTFVHVGLAAMLAAALLVDRFDSRALLIVLAAAALPDLDTVLGLWVPGAHRTVLHNLVLPTVLLVAIVWDARWRERSWLRARWGDAGVRMAWVSVLAGWLVSQVLVDAFYNGANLLWPVYDQFIDLSGYLVITDQRGIVQTMFEIEHTPSGPRIADDHTRGGRHDTHYYTGVDPGPTADPGVERIFPVAERGTLFVIALAGYLTAGFRLWERRRSD